MSAAAHIWRPGTTQTAAYDATTAITAAVGTQTRVVRLVATTDCHYDIQKVPVAVVATSPYLPADTVEYIKINPGEKVAFIKNADAGSAWVTEVT